MRKGASFNRKRNPSALRRCGSGDSKAPLRAGRIAVEDRGEQSEALGLQLHARAEIGERKGRAAGRQIGDRQRRPSEAVVDENLRRGACHELLIRAHLAEADGRALGDALLEPGLEEARRRRRLYIAHGHQRARVELVYAAPMQLGGVGVEGEAGQPESLVEIGVQSGAQLAVIDRSAAQPAGDVRESLAEYLRPNSKPRSASASRASAGCARDLGRLDAIVGGSSLAAQDHGDCRRARAPRRPRAAQRALRRGRG